MLSALAVGLLAAAPAIDVDPCVHASAEEVSRQLEIELSNGPRDVPVVARVRCLTGGLLELTVDDEVTLKSVVRKLDLTGAPSRGRARTIALALAELIEASWSELLLMPPEIQPAGPQVTEAQRQVAERILERERRRAADEQLDGKRVVTVSVVGSAQRFVEAALWQWGGGARVAWVPGLLGVAADFRAGHGQLDGVLADTVDGSVAAVIRSTFDSVVALDGGLGVRLGSAQLHGTGLQDAEPQSGPWLAPMAFFEAGVTLRRFVAQVGVEGGLVGFGVHGTLVGGQQETGVYGAYFQLTLGVGLRL